MAGWTLTFDPSWMLALAGGSQKSRTRHGSGETICLLTPTLNEKPLSSSSVSFRLVLIPPEKIYIICQI